MNIRCSLLLAAFRHSNVNTNKPIKHEGIVPRQHNKQWRQAGRVESPVLEPAGLILAASLGFSQIMSECSKSKIPRNPHIKY